MQSSFTLLLMVPLSEYRIIFIDPLIIKIKFQIKSIQRIQYIRVVRKNNHLCNSTWRKKKEKKKKKKNNQKSIRSRADQFLKAILSIKVYVMLSSRDLLIKQRIQTFLSDHAKANGQLYLPDDRRIYFHYFKGWKEWFLLRREPVIANIVRFYERNETAYIRFGTFYVNRIKKIWIEEEEWHMRIILTMSHIAYVFCYRGRFDFQ